MLRTTFLGEPPSHDAGRVGAKAATLSKLAARYRIPAGFCLEAGAHAALASALDGDAGALAALRALIAVGHAGLVERTGEADPAVAVRSSALGEDGADASFAGQHETVLNVRGVDGIVAAVLRCWRSAASERATAYRAERGISSRPLVGVLVQQLVDAEVAVIAFSAHPVTRDRNVVFLNASWGLGESLASGAVTPDEVEVLKEDLRILRRAIADKAVETVRTADGIAERPVPEDRRRAPALRDEAAREVARLALALESDTGDPVDVECAFSGGELYLLQSRPITTLADDAFPVTWDDPQDATRTWTLEDAHMAEARPYLSADYAFNGPQVGINQRMEDAGAPTRVRYRLVNNYVYVLGHSLDPKADLNEARLRVARRARTQARVLRRTWDEEYLPAVREHYAWMDAVRADQADRTELVAAWTELWRRINKVWIIHMRVTGPAYNLLDELGEVYSELTGRPPTDAPVLVQGRADTLQDLERGLQELVRAIRAAPAVAAALEAGELRSLDALGTLAGGATVREAIEAFLQRFGDAGQLAIDLRSPAWRDEPGLLLAELARRMRAELEDPDARVARLRATSDALAAEVRASLAGRPEDLARFEEVLAVARAAGPLTEEHNFWIDRLVSSYARRAVLRFADRLVRDGSLDSPADMFFFWVAELSEALAAPRDLRPVARERARELRRSERLRPPRIIGAAPAAGGGAPNARMIDLGYRVEQTGDGAVLQGVPASAGVARGPARLIRDSSRFDRFTTGDVLVCRSSNVSWIPLFTMASAVIADVGGALSHAAVVAREFGVPAVVGTGTALDLLVDGELVEVDGTAGTVRRLGATAG